MGEVYKLFTLTWYGIDLEIKRRIRHKSHEQARKEAVHDVVAVQPTEVQRQHEERVVVGASDVVVHLRSDVG